MANEKVYLEADSIQSHIKTAVRDVIADAEQAGLVVASIEAELAEMFADCSVGELRRIAAVVRTHTLGLLLNAARMIGRAERLETIADLRATMASEAEGLT